MTTISRLNNSHDDSDRRGRNAIWVSMIVLAALAVALAASVLQNLSTEAWQIYLLAGTLIAYSLLTMLVMGLGRKRPEQAMLALALGGGVASMAAALALKAVGVPLAFLLMTTVVLLAALTLHRAWVFRLVILAGAAALGDILLHYLPPSLQLNVAAARPALLLIYAVLLIPLTLLIMRQFAAFALRTKLILLCIIAALIPLALSLGLNYGLAKLDGESASAMTMLSTVVDNALLTGLFVMLLAAGLALMAMQSLVAPLKRLTTVVEKVKSGNFYPDARVEANDEI